MRAIDMEFYKRALSTIPMDDLVDLKRRSTKYPGLIDAIDDIIHERHCDNQHTQASATGQTKIILNMEHDSWNNPEPIAVQSH